MCGVNSEFILCILLILSSLQTGRADRINRMDMMKSEEAVPIMDTAAFRR